MSKSKIVGIMALIIFTMGMVLVGDTLAGESGKAAGRLVSYGTTFHVLKVPDVEGHTIMMWEAKGIGFSEKWGNYLYTEMGTGDFTKETISGQGYLHATFLDGSTYTVKAEGKGGKGTWTFIKGTGKLEGIQGGGPYKTNSLAPDRWYTDWEGEYTLP
jgi:hypothetical protein